MLCTRNIKINNAKAPSELKGAFALLTARIALICDTGIIGIRLDEGETCLKLIWRRQIAHLST